MTNTHQAAVEGAGAVAPAPLTPKAPTTAENRELIGRLVELMVSEPDMGKWAVLEKACATIVKMDNEREDLKAEFAVLLDYSNMQAAEISRSLEARGVAE